MATLDELDLGLGPAGGRFVARWRLAVALVDMADDSTKRAEACRGPASGRRLYGTPRNAGALTILANTVVAGVGSLYVLTGSTVVTTSAVILLAVLAVCSGLGRRRHQ